ncbi:hypothetical protein Tsubulata_016442 [Turnera subulata]|uniref:tRNA pseudouridine synthase n=1 Tax=Turnera subulata TaxID=218843 RepID=A0A9Q0F5K6_9ROSI|nr:hypothetical protein Tsubulata_016442 [Turnera subulata]
MRVRLPAAPILFAGQKKTQRSGLCTFSVPMEKEGKTYYHYDHGDACRFSRWTARESFQFMYGRPWQEVVNFYFNLVNGGCSLMDLFGTRTDLDFARDDDVDATAASEEETVSVPNKDKSGRFSRVTFKILLSYHGPSFDGWQKQPGLNTVQGYVETSLGKFIDEKKAELLKQKDKPLEGCAVVAGRTDKGVSALQQVCSFYTWRKDVIPGDIEDAINNVAPGKLRVISVSKVSRVFHPNFSAKWRRYLYIFPVTDGENIDRGFQMDEDFSDFSSEQTYNEETHEFVELKSEENFGNSIPSDGCEDGAVQKPRSFSICKVNKMLQQLEGKLLSFKMFARDTKASRNM